MEVAIALRACFVCLLFMKHPNWVTQNHHAVVGHTFRNIGVQMCMDKCRNTARCVYFIFMTRSLTCRVSSVVRTKKEHIVLHIKRSERKWSRCPKRSCGYGRKCLTTRLGGSQCIRTGRIHSAMSQSWRRRKSTSTSVKVIHHVARSFTEDAIYGFGTKLTLSMNYVKIACNGSFEDVTIQLNSRKRSRSYVCSIVSLSPTPWGKGFTCAYVACVVAGKTKPRLVYVILFSSHRGSIHDNNVFLRSRLPILSMAVCVFGGVYILETSNMIHHYQRRQNVLTFKGTYELTHPVLSVHYAFKKAELSLVTLTDIRVFDVPIQRPMSPKYSYKANVESWKILCLSPDEKTILQVDRKRPFRFMALK